MQAYTRNTLFDQKSPQHPEVFFGGGGGGPKLRIITILKKINAFISSLLQANIRNTLFDQRSPGHPKVGVLRWHRHKDTDTDTHTHKHKHCNCMTESA